MFILAEQISGLGSLDYVILAIYFLAMVAIGVWFSRGQDSEEEFLMGGRSMHWLLVSMAAVATMFSGVSLIGAPGYAFTNDARMAMTAPIGLLTLPIILLMLPYLVRLRMTTVFEYLEQRFNLALRLIASALFLGTKFVYVGVVIYTSALLLSTAVEMPMWVSILLMGIIATALTMLGGMKAVMWSDAIQFVIMMAGIIVIFAVLMMPDANGGGGVAEYWRIASDAGKTRMTNFSFSWSELTTWSIFASVAMTGIGGTFSDQLMMQRYFSAGGTRAVIKSFWTSMAISMPTVLILYLIGILLFGFYGSGRHAIPDEIRANGDKVLPFFVSTQLPVGLKGLVISAIVAATLSTVSSVLNSLCTATITDFYLRLRKPKLPSRGFEVVTETQDETALTNNDPADDRSNVALSRLITVGWGALGTLLACYVDRLGMIIDQTNTLFGLIGGGLGGIFMLGLFTKRSNANGTIVGAIAGTLATWSVMKWTSIHYMWYAVVGTATTLIVGYVASLILPGPSPRANEGQLENDESLRGQGDLLGTDTVRADPVSPGR